MNALIYYYFFLFFLLLQHCILLNKHYKDAQSISGYLDSKETIRLTEELNIQWIFLLLLVPNTSSHHFL